MRHKEGVFHKEEMLGKLKYVKRNGGTVIGYTCKPDSLLVV